MICAICAQPLHLENGVWVHPGGGAYVQYCGSCTPRTKWDGPTRQTCPKCGKGGPLWRDEHCVVPMQRGA